MKTLRILATALALLQVGPALALDRVLPAPRIKDNGDVRLSDDLKIGRYQGGKFISQPDAIQIQGPGSTGPVDGMSVTPLPGMVARALSTSLADLPVRPEQYKLASDPDDTLSFQRAAATGRTIALQDGKTYILCAAVPLTRLVGLGGIATIKACPGFPYVGGVEPFGSFFYNPNYLAGQITDTNLLVANVRFDGTDITANGAHPSTGEFHAIKFRMARDILIENVHCVRVGDCTALQATDRSIVRNSTATLVTNVGFDHWEGSSNALVENTTTTCDPTTASEAGIMFSGASSTLANRQTVNPTSRGNRILYGACKSGVFFNQLSAGSSTVNAVSENDTVDAAGVTTAGGIIMEGNVQGGRITGLTVLNGNGPTAISLRQDTAGSGKPKDILVDGPRVYNWTTDGANYSPFTLFGTGHVLTNALLKGGTNSTSVATDSATTVVSGTFNPGTTFGPVQAVGGTFTNPGCRVAGTVASPGTATACN